MQFTWDKAKEQNNRRKHGVGFETVPRVFADPGRVLLADRKHSLNEGRFWCVGHDGFGILTVRFVLRAGVIRVIGAGYWRKGERIYEEKS
ncbi:MAG: BrnT family toxin [Opitutaceae bacterium]|nr:BrnT family toxin [Opitutaceae bacterium]